MCEDRNHGTGKVDKNTVVPLPEGDACVRLHLLDGGSFTASESRMHANVAETSFQLIEKIILPECKKFMLDVTNAGGQKVSILDQIQRHGGPGDVASVIFRELFDGIHDVACWTNPDGHEASFQEDIPAANDTIGSIMYMEQKFRAHIAFAHNISLIRKGEDKVLLLLSMLDSDMERLVRNEILAEKCN
ncbi:hypothetical protein T310_1251 [Rasamsonia emersonii CBS 393.64]|uniref:Uncharacterized protein n=1 Tax=Rasamsonia emersonii (strain ATCC 16479 / CBS 393.64 / IMI 116815) TaxID=1408163 RepID=A0A0F4Z2I0_RASE3|nr:hypothetical protein T310_1251 [Rasamsonia emersonii CBS 393.64]KKA24702.1 hypothetical protein T310_1251 [Rasamsonia emersonii CBS 393.64]